MKKKLFYLIGIPIGIVLLAFAYYAISPLFINIKADDLSPAKDNTSNTASTQPIAPTFSTRHKDVPKGS